MAIFGLSRSRLSLTPELQAIVAEYKRLRAASTRLVNELVRRLKANELNEGGEKLGIIRRGIFVFESEDVSAVLMDYCVYEVRRSGRNAVEKYLCENPPEADSDEMNCLHAMQHSRYAIIAVLCTLPGVGCQLRDLAAWMDAVAKILSRYEGAEREQIFYQTVQRAYRLESDR